MAKSVADNFYGKIPPQSTEVEKAVLGMILLDKNGYDEAAGILKPEMFYTDGHQLIFKAMKNLADKNQPIDIHSVTEELSKGGDLEKAGGAYYVSTTTNAVVSAAHMKNHARIVFEKWMLREIIRVAGDSLTRAYNGEDPFALISDSQSGLSSVADAIPNSDMVPISSVLVDAFKLVNEWKNSYAENGGITGIPSGFTEIDRCTRGWQPGDLIYFGARPSVGKTAFALNVARNAAKFLKGKNGGSVAVWSLEMKSTRLMLRFLAAEAQEYLTSIQKGQLTDQQMQQLFVNGVAPLSKLDLYFDDSAGLTIQKLKTKARKMKRNQKLRMIIIDYLQLMTPDKAGNREQEVSKISRALKELALELQVPIIALSQVGRDVEKSSREPMLSDLRESGSIEQDADVVVFLWAPTEAEIQDDISMASKRYIKIAKQRDGMLLKTTLDFKDVYQLFTEPGRQQPPQTSLPAGTWRQIGEKESDPF